MKYLFVIISSYGKVVQFYSDEQFPLEQIRQLGHKSNTWIVEDEEDTIHPVMLDSLVIPVVIGHRYELM